jgi:hypothetical protein
MSQNVRLCIVEAASQNELAERVADMELAGWRRIDGRTIASPTQEVPYWVQVLYWAPRALPVETVRVNPLSFKLRNEDARLGR